MEFPQALFEQATVRATRWQRISSEEEERAREGYHVTTHFRFPAALAVRNLALSDPGELDPLIEVAYVSQAEIWRINHGWRRSPDHNGFVIDTNTGAWQRQSDDEDEPNGAPSRATRSQIRPYVSDTRNLLLLRTSETTDEEFLRTLAYSFRRAIQLDYQIEEQEIAVELIGLETAATHHIMGGGRGRHRRLGPADRGAWRISEACANRAPSLAFRRDGRGSSGVGRTLSGSLLRLPSQLREPGRSPLSRSPPRARFSASPRALCPHSTR